MQARMKNPAMIIPEAMQATQALHAATGNGGVPSTMLALAHLRARQMNASLRWRLGGMRPTSPTPNVPRCRSPRPSLDSVTGRTRCRTRSGTKPLGITTSRRLPP
jgi:hypothetical protein